MTYMQVPSKLLSPNLHCVVCRLPRQERLRGNSARENELFMERYMSPFKARSKYRLTTLIEVSFVRNTEATQRSLLRNMARHGCVSLYDLSDWVEERRCSFRGAGRLIKSTTTVTVRGLSPANAVELARVLLALADLQLPDDGVSILREFPITVHTGVTVRGRKFDSRQTPNRTVNSRSYQNSFCRVRSKELVSARVLPDGTLHGYPLQLERPPVPESVVGGYVYALVECYLQAGATDTRRSRASSRQAPEATHGGPLPETASSPGHPDGPGVFALVQVLRGAKQKVFAGTPTVLTEEPVEGLSFGDMYVVPVEAFQQQLLVLKASDQTQVLRFVECPGKLNML